MDTTSPDTGHEADDKQTPAFEGATPPPGWPMELQVAIAFWAVTAAVLTLAGAWGSGWAMALVPIAIDYVLYLRTDRCVMVELLLDARWNRPSGAPPRHAPDESWLSAVNMLREGRSKALGLKDIDLPGMVRSAREDTAAFVDSLRGKASGDSAVGDAAAGEPDRDPPTDGSGERRPAA